MRTTAEIFGSAIVLVGSFNPAIFSIDWLEKNKLVGSGDAEAARTQSNLLVSRQASICQTDWFALQVLENQLSLTSQGALSPAFRDLAEGICACVPHTPVTALGLNFMGHYKMASMDDYHKIGDTLAPKAIWSQLFSADQALGLQQLTIKVQRARRDAANQPLDNIQMQVQPSARVPVGIFLALNDHRESFSQPNAGGDATAGAAGKIISTEWERCWGEAIALFEGLLDATLSA